VNRQFFPVWIRHCDPILGTPTKQVYLLSCLPLHTFAAAISSERASACWEHLQHGRCASSAR